jgi:hypothetical protein
MIVNSAVLVTWKFDGGDKSVCKWVHYLLFVQGWLPIMNKEMVQEVWCKHVNTRQCNVQFDLSNENRQELCNTLIT